MDIVASVQTSTAIAGGRPIAAVPEDASIRQAAKEFEAAFIGQMLQYAGLDEAFSSQEGLATESLSTFVIEKIATQMTEQGGFGLAEQFYQKLLSDVRAGETQKGHTS